jgi:hypothetical protein
MTIVVYESDMHHCLLEYKIFFEEKNKSIRLIRSEIIGDSLVIFQENKNSISTKLKYQQILSETNIVEGIAYSDYFQIINGEFEDQFTNKIFKSNFKTYLD